MIHPCKMRYNGYTLADIADLHLEPDEALCYVHKNVTHQRLLL